MSSDNTRLLQLRKELKSWESKFYKKHNRKPSKEDLQDDSCRSIRETYREYHRLKSIDSSQTANMEQVKSKVDKRSQVASAPLKPSNVFGSHLNKKSNTSRQDRIGINRPTKTYKWIKGHGFLMDPPKSSEGIENSLVEKEHDQQQPAVTPEEQMVDISNVLDRVDLKDMTTQPSSMICTLDSSVSIDPVSNIHTSSNILPKPKLRHWSRISKKWLENIELKMDSKAKATIKEGEKEALEEKIISKLNNKSDSCLDLVESSSRLGSASKSNSNQITNLSKSSSSHLYQSKQSSVQVNTYDEELEPHSCSASPRSCVSPASTDDEDNSNSSISSMDSFHDEYMYCTSTTSTEQQYQQPLPINEKTTEATDHDSKLESYNIDEILSMSDSECTSTAAPANGSTATIGRRKTMLLSNVIDEVEDEVEEESVDHSLSEGGTNNKRRFSQDEEDLVEESDIPKPKRTGSLSDNFVKLNMKVKRFSRRPMRITGSRYKRQQWKQRQKSQHEGSRSSSALPIAKNSCYRCGKPGHWARNCTDSGGFKNLGRFDGQSVSHTDDDTGVFEEGIDLQQLLDDERAGPMTCVFPTVEEANQLLKNTIVSTVDSMETSPSSSDQSSYRNVEPLLKLVDGKAVKSVPEEVKIALNALGYDGFRAGQQDTVLQILSGASTILVQPTGSGKSLCYQLPAYCYAQHFPGCITLVVSPLISLMQDQINNLPAALKGACIHTGLSRQQRDRIISDIAAGNIHVLLMSPETLVGGANSNGWSFLSSSKLPPIAFACIDEAHCLSEWSHNFRPSYLRLCKVLRQTLGIKCVLALTATASTSTINDMMELLDVKREHTIIGAAVPDNLVLSVSCEDNRETALVDLLHSPPFSSCDSIIVYCTRQQTTERVAQILRTSLQIAGNDSPLGDDDTVGRGRSRGKRRKVSWSAECYHAGLSPAQRKRNQSDFMAGRLRVIVCTVAFGMGLDKRDVRSVIHYNMPKSFESFVQEIGRAGRDGEPAYCHVFIDKEGSDILELRRHIYSNSMDHLSVKQLVQNALPMRCSPEKECKGHEVAIPIESLVQMLDTKEEVLLTLLCYLESHDMIHLMNPINDTCCLKSYGGVKQLVNVSRRVPAVAMAIAIEKEKGTVSDSSSVVTFSVTSVADALGFESEIIWQVLKDLCYSCSNSNDALMVEFKDLSFHFKTKKCFSNDEKDSVCKQLMGKINCKESRNLERLYQLYGILRQVTMSGDHPFTAVDSSTTMRDIIHLHFTDKLSPKYLQSIGVDIRSLPVLEPSSERRITQVRKDIQTLVGMHHDKAFTGKVVARILQGIASPCYPSETWGKGVYYWRKYLDIDFNTLCKIATDVIINR